MIVKLFTFNPYENGYYRFLQYNFDSTIFYTYLFLLRKNIAL